MGFNQSDKLAPWTVISRLLWSRFLHRRIIRDNNSEKDTLLYRQPCCSLCPHWFALQISLLSHRKRKFCFFAQVSPWFWFKASNNQNSTFLALLTTIVFYIPAFEHKMTFSILLLVSLTFFYIVLVELIPPTSLVVPLIGKYLLFTMFLVTLSITVSVHIIRMYRR